MGIIKNFLKKYTYVDPNAKPGVLDKLFEGEPDVSLVDSDIVEEMSKSITGKIKSRKRELMIMGMTILASDFKKVPNSEQVVKEYNDLIKDLEELEKLDNGSNNSLLKTKYSQFEIKYEQKIELLKSSYLLSELTSKNDRMKTDFNKKAKKQIKSNDIDEYETYIKNISFQIKEFSPSHQKQFVDELIKAEYRLMMLQIMKGYKEKNPFAGASKVRKERYEALFMEDVEEMGKQYDNIVGLQNSYIKSGVLTKKEFKLLDESSDRILKNLNSKFIDDFSISEIFTNEGYGLLKEFLDLKAWMNKLQAEFLDGPVPTEPDIIGGNNR